MKKLYIIAILCQVFLMNVCAQTMTLTIKGSIVENPQEGDTVKLCTYKVINGDNQLQTLSSGIIHNGTFSLSYQCSPEDNVGFVTHGETFVSVIIEPGELRVSPTAPKVVGTPQNDRWRIYHQRTDSVNKLVEQETPKYDAADHNGYIAKIYQNEKKYGQSLIDEQLSVAREFRGKTVGALALVDYTVQKEGNPQEALDTISALGFINHPDKTLQGHIEKLRKALVAQPGKKFIDFTIADGNADGTPANLSDFVGKGKVVLVDFWGSWCMWCVRETPNLKAVYEKYKGQEFTVLGLACKDKRENTEKACEYHGTQWPQIFNCGDIPMKLYGLSALPQIMLFDKDGTLLARDLRGEDIMKAVDKAMNK